MMKSKLLLAACLAGGASVAGAAEDASGGGLGVRIGTSGIGAEYALALGSHFDLRAGYYFGSFSQGVTEDGIDYDGDFRFNAGAVMLDYRPFAGGFRISAGGYTGAPEIKLVAEGDNEQFDVGNRQYTADGRLDGDIDLGGAAPYVGIGWGGRPSGTGFGFSFDVGVMFTSSPGISLTATGNACDSTVVACNPNGLAGFDVNDPNDPRAQAFQSELEQERQNLEDDAKDYKYWPVVNLGVHYRF